MDNHQCYEYVATFLIVCISHHVHIQNSPRPFEGRVLCTPVLGVVVNSSGNMNRGCLRS
jgi:hypothetical protein